MKETALVIMAAGIGSRFGGGIKQLAPVGPNGEIIMDYLSMTPLRPDLTKSYLLSVKIWKRILRRLSETALPSRSRLFMPIRSWTLFQRAILCLRAAKNPGEPVRLF